MERLFGTDGVRGIFGDFLTEDLARSLGAALTVTLRKDIGHSPSIAIGMDTRISSPILYEAFADGVTSCGGNVHYIGVAPTPAVAYLTLCEEFDSGAVISASHNSYEYNGIKIIGANGQKLSDNAEDRIEEMIGALPCSYNGNLGKIYKRGELLNGYTDYIKGFLESGLTDRKIVIDCANGATVSTAKKIFCDTFRSCIIINSDPDGKNINHGCGSTNTDMLRGVVLKEGYDIGFAFDGDGDRCVGIDGCGNELNGDVILAILADGMKSRQELTNDTLVATVMSNYGLKSFCNERGIRFVETAVGDKYVNQAMRDGGYALGGEQSGHTVFGGIMPTGDGQLTAIKLICETKRDKLERLSSFMVSCPEFTVNISADKKKKTAFSNNEYIKAIIEDERKRICGKGEIIARCSGTEPLIRITVKGEEGIGVKEHCTNLADEIRKLLL